MGKWRVGRGLTKCANSHLHGRSTDSQRKQRQRQQDLPPVEPTAAALLGVGEEGLVDASAELHRRVHLSDEIAEIARVRRCTHTVVC